MRPSAAQLAAAQPDSDDNRSSSGSSSSSSNNKNNDSNNTSDAVSTTGAGTAKEGVTLRGTFVVDFLPVAATWMRQVPLRGVFAGVMERFAPRLPRHLDSSKLSRPEMTSVAWPRTAVRLVVVECKAYHGRATQGHCRARSTQHSTAQRSTAQRNTVGS